jgi:hypothetical protein
MRRWTRVARVGIGGVPGEPGNGGGEADDVLAAARRDLQRAAAGRGETDQLTRDQVSVAERGGRRPSRVVLRHALRPAPVRKRSGLSAATMSAGKAGLRPAIRSATNRLAAGAVWKP